MGKEGVRRGLKSRVMGWMGWDGGLEDNHERQFDLRIKSVGQMRR